MNTITVTSESVIAICAVVTLAAGGCLWGMRAVIREELSSFRTAFEEHKAVTEFRLDELEGKPRRRAHAT